jgi:hypothetical protein
MMPPDVAAALGAERRAAMVAEASRRRLAADLALYRRLSRPPAGPVRLAARAPRLAALWRVWPAFRGPSRSLPACDCCTAPL